MTVDDPTKDSCHGEWVVVSSRAMQWKLYCGLCIEGLLELVIPLWERVELLFKIRQLREVKKNGCRRVLSGKG